MATGKHTPNSPAKDNHMANFETAMKDALRQHGCAGDEQVNITFGAVVTPNPGGIKEYVVTITPGP